MDNFELFNTIVSSYNENNMDGFEFQIIKWINKEDKNPYKEGTK